MQGQYTVQRKVADLPEGYEFQPNRFIADKNDLGCHVQYCSQEGDMRYIMVGFRGEGYASSKSWMHSGQIIDCIVDFVPASRREAWVELQKLGKCYLDYDPGKNSWSVVFPENKELIFSLDGCSRTQALAIDDLMFDISFNQPILHNGHRWFDCRDSSNFKKISDEEAKRLINE